MKRRALIILICSFHAVAICGTDTLKLKTHLQNLISTTGYRNYLNTKALDTAAAYIFRQLSLYADTVYYQEYTAKGRNYRNVVASYSRHKPKTVVVGAHYDVCEDQDGADDNASGVAGLLELARLLKKQETNYRIDLVAYTLEEPPAFRSPYMGSYVHARSLNEEGRNVYGMISLEMIGFFKDERKSQSYPLGILRLFYGSRANYITLIRKYGAGKFARRFSRQFADSRQIKTKKFSGPRSLAGIDYSDHLNYWKFGYSALMITDTSFYRNANYHEPTDTIGTLDIKRMAKVIDATFAALTALK